MQIPIGRFQKISNMALKKIGCLDMSNFVTTTIAKLIKYQLLGSLQDIKYL